MILSKYSMGVGDRFGRQGVAQLTAFVEAKAMGVDITPVWNKSNREHLIVHTHPDSVRAEADAAVKALGWKGPHRVDADHIGLKTVDAFLAASDFFTLDVADFVGQAAPDAEIQDFVARHRRYATTLTIPGIDRTLAISEKDIAGIILNRWGHAFVNPQPGFYYGKAGRPAPRHIIRRRFGRIAFGHAELNGHQHWVGAAEEGRRAAKQVMSTL